MYSPLQSMCLFSTRCTQVNYFTAQGSLRLSQNGAALFVVRRKLCYGLKVPRLLSRIRLPYNNHPNVNLLLTTRPLSLKVKSSPVINELDKDEKFKDNVSSAVIEVGEEKFRQLSKEFVQSLSKNQLKNVENVWKNVPPLTLTGTLDHYAKLSKIKLTGNVWLDVLWFLIIPFLTKHRSSRLDNIGGLLHGSTWRNELSSARLNFDWYYTYFGLSSSMESLFGSAL